MHNSQLQSIIGKNVVELDFVRRHPKLGWSNIRGMFGTTNPGLLNGEFGFQVIHFKPPKGVGMGYDYKACGLCVIFDIFRQEYRVFGAEQVNIHKVWPLSTEEETEEFYKYFYDAILNMSNTDKLKFMGYRGRMAAPVTLEPPKSIPVGNTTEEKIPEGLLKKIQRYFGSFKDFMKQRLFKK